MEGICEGCGLPLAAGDAFCGNCGHRVTVVPSWAADAKTVVPAAPFPAAAPESPAVPAALAEPPGSGWRPRPYQPPATAETADAAVGLPAQNEHYLGQRLLYDKVPEGSFDPIGNPRLIRQFIWHALLYLLVYWLSGLLALIPLGILGLLVGFSAAGTLWTIGAVVFGVLFLCLYWLIPVPAQLSEWKFFVDGKAPIAPVAFDHIAWALQQRQTPLDLIQVRRLKLAGTEARDYLELRRNLFSGFISCFAYGNDLYVGWTFWLRVSPARVLLMVVARLWQTLMRRGTDLYVSLRYDYARAMREAMHSAAREGVDVAVGQTQPHGQGVIGSTVQVAVTELDAF
jgi:hypothetical protein